MKRKRFSEVELEIIRRSVRLEIHPQDIAANLSQGGFPRTYDTLVSKIHKMGLVYPSKVKYRQEKAKKKAESAYHKRYTTKAERGRLLQMNPNYTDKWQDAIKLSGAKLIEFKGHKTWAIDGKPVTIYHIMKYIQP